MPVKKLLKEDKEFLSPESYIVREVEAGTRQKELEVEERESRLAGKIQMTRRQEKLFTILVVAFPMSVIFTLVVVLMDGYKLWCLDVETATINLLIGATIAEIAGLLTLILSSRLKIKGSS